MQIDRSLPSQAPSYSPSPPPGLTSWGRLQEARPPLGRPSCEVKPLHPAGTEPTALSAETGGAPRKAARDSRLHSLLGIVVPALRPFYPTEPRARRARWTGADSLMGKEFLVPNDVLFENGAGLHIPMCSEVGRTRK